MDNSDFAYEILVVDDILEAAQDYARLISTKTGLKVIPTSDPDEAVRIVQHNDIKVLVLDQKNAYYHRNGIIEEIKTLYQSKSSYVNR